MQYVDLSRALLGRDTKYRHHNTIKVKEPAFSFSANQFLTRKNTKNLTRQTITLHKVIQLMGATTDNEYTTTESPLCNMEENYIG